MTAMAREIRLALLIWLALLVLLGLTAGLALLPLGPTAAVVANLGIAALKTAAVCWVFMHLRDSTPLTHLTAATALLFLFIMIFNTLSDYLFRGGTG